MKQQNVFATRFAVRRGSGLKAKAWIWVTLAGTIPLRRRLRRHPTLLRTISHLTNREILIAVSTPLGRARLIYNLSQDSELLVVEEILRSEHYIATKKHDLLVDFGAFRGISTLFLADQTKAEQIVAVEPNHKNFTILSQRLGRLLPQAKCICAAVAAEQGSALFAGDGVSGAVADCGEEVKTVRPCDVCDLLSASNPVVKVDIEGAEEHVLPLLLESLPEHSIVFVETHNGEDAGAVLLEPFRKRGYGVARSGMGKTAPDSPYVDWKVQR
jgi:FkbM family methyltransferase